MTIKLKPLRKIKMEMTPPPKVGEMLEGKILASDRSSLFVDLGAKGIGVIFGAEFYKAKEMLKNVKTGDPIAAKLVGLENEEGYRELSLVDAAREITWKDLREKREENKSFEVKIKKANKGGLLTEINGLAAFLPVSQLSSGNYPRVGDADFSKIAKELQKFIGQTLTVKILDIDQKKNKIILSEKTKNKEESIPKKGYKEGELVAGKVSGITNFGAFVNLEDGSEGMLYPNEVPNVESKKIEKVLKIGEPVKAKVLKITGDQIYLSLKI